MPASRIPPLRFCIGHCKAIVKLPGFSEPVIRRRRFNGPHLRNKVGICGDPMTPPAMPHFPEENPASSDSEDDVAVKNVKHEGLGDTESENDSTLTKKRRNKRNRKEQERIRAQAQAFQRLVIRGTHRKRGTTAASMSAAEGVSHSQHRVGSRPGSIKAPGTALKKKKKAGRRRKTRRSSKGIIRIPFFNTTRSRSASAPPKASKEMQEMFIRKGIFVPKGYTLTKNCLIPIKKRKTICLDGCRYDVVKRIANSVGFKEVAENDVWNIIWTDVPISLDKALEMRRFQDAHSIFWGTAPPLQRANHFPGMNEICRKDRLARNLNRMKKSFPTEYNFFPRTWSLPADISDLIMYSRKKKHLTYICKPDSGCQGRGIFLMRNMKKLNPFAKLICQVYIPRPFLIDGYKFDLRIYTLITSCDPLHIYIYDEGIARFATVKYEAPSDSNVDVIFMHLTNYSLNKFSQSYAPEPDGSKRKVSSVYNWMESQGLNLKKLKDDIDAVIVKTMIAAQPTLRHYYRASFPKHDRGCACFEILGFDILLDHKLKPYLLEVNHSPSFNLDLPVDAEIKEALLTDTFNKLYLGRPSDVRSHSDTKRRPETPSNSLTLTDCAGHSISRALEIQFMFESHQKGNFRLVYPAENALKYAHFFEQSPSPALLDAAQVARRRHANIMNPRYKSPSLNPVNPYTVTKRFNKNGTVSTTKKNKRNSYIAVPYDPENDGGEDQDDEAGISTNLSGLQKVHARATQILNDPRLIDIIGKRDGVEQENQVPLNKVPVVIPPEITTVPPPVSKPRDNVKFNQILKANRMEELLTSDARRRHRREKKLTPNEVMTKTQQEKQGTLNPPPKDGNSNFVFKYPAPGQDLASSLSPSMSQLGGDSEKTVEKENWKPRSIQKLFEQAKERAQKRMDGLLVAREQMTQEQRQKMQLWNEKSSRIRNWIAGGHMEPMGTTQPDLAYPAPDVASTMVAVKPPRPVCGKPVDPFDFKSKENKLTNSKFHKEFEKDMRHAQSDALGDSNSNNPRKLSQELKTAINERYGPLPSDLPLKDPPRPKPQLRETLALDPRNEDLYTSSFKDYALAPCINFAAPEPPRLLKPGLFRANPRNSSYSLQGRPPHLRR